MDERTCDACGKPIIVKSPQHRFCSQRCGSQARGWRTKGAACCSWCAVLFAKSSPDQVCCSRRCSNFSRFASGRTCTLTYASCLACRQVFLLGRRPQLGHLNGTCRANLKGQYLRRGTLVKQECVQCSRVFDQISTTRVVAHCSDVCRKNDPRARALKKASKARRRAREKTAVTERFTHTEIFQRDGWRCGLCGLKVNRRAVVPHPKAPVLDHVVPLAAHGDHTRANVQCAHFLCNSIKSDGVANGGEQLRLVG